MNFNEAENYLLSLGNEVTSMKLGLENVSKLFAALGDPQKNYLKVQVAGTNGKGSVCAFLNSICVTAGIKTGMYTSPHLVSITERIQINGIEIAEDEFARLATLVREGSEKLVDRGDLETVPTFFEQVTAIALVAFAEAKVELAILETGLGGRLDATTAANAEISAITRIDIDHQKYLGETIEEIAAEKAAIIRAGSKVVVGEQQPEAMTVILRRCREVGVEPRFASEVVAREVSPPRGAKISFGRVGDPRPSESPTMAFALPSRGRRQFSLGLLGQHQVENARTAMLVTELLPTQFQITEIEIVEGLSRARHAGRLEWIGQFLLDGAHNAGGAAALRAYLDELVTQPITMIFGAMNDKNVNEIGQILFPRADRLILTRPDNSRALYAETIVEALPHEMDRTSVSVTDDVSAAIRKARELSDSKDVILVTGSLYLVGEVRTILMSNLPKKLKTEK